jgi:hypothetical protein
MNPREYQETLQKAPSKQSIDRLLNLYRRFRGRDNVGPTPNRGERNVLKYIRDNEIAPIVGKSDEAGRFWAEYADELDQPIAEYKSRMAEMGKTVRALENMRRRLPDRPAKGQNPEFKQPALLEIPEHDPIPHWRW